MPHKIEISDKTYEAIKEYCLLNGLKIGQFADKLLHEGLMVEKYGDTPFTNYRKKIAHEFPPEKFQELYQANPAPPTKEEAEEIKEIVPPPVPEELVERNKTLEKEIFETVTIPATAFSAHGTHIPPEVMKEAVEKYNEKLENKPKTIKRRLK